MSIFEDYAREIEYCTFCPKMCRFSCTVAEAEKRESVTPTGKMSLLHLLRDGAIKLDTETAEIFYKCTNCMLCTTFCAHEIEVAHVLNAARSYAVEQGIVVNELADIRTNLKETANPFGRDLQGLLTDIVPEQYHNPEAQVLYFPGCVATLHQPAMITDTFKIFEKLGIDYVGVDPLGEICCGYPMIAAGFEEMFNEHVQRTGKRLASYKKIISGCPTCVYYLKSVYPEHGFNIGNRVFHTSEFLSEELSRHRIKSTNVPATNVCYFDPCYLTRYLNVIELPRELLTKFGAELSEMIFCGVENRCCGGGGLVTATSPKTALAIARDRWDDFLATGADVLVTACPSCAWMLSEKGERKRVIDIANFLVDRI